MDVWIKPNQPFSHLKISLFIKEFVFLSMTSTFLFLVYADDFSSTPQTYVESNET